MVFNPNIHHRRSIRLKGYDYSQAGLYFITICCQDRRSCFGKIENGNMQLNEYGQIAHNEWIKTGELRSQITLGAFVVMPNHVHGILEINGRGELHSPENGMTELHSLINKMDEFHSPIYNIGEFHSPNNKTGELHSLINKTGECDSPLRGPSNNVGAIIRGYKSSVTKQLGLMGFDKKLWQRNYYEHIIRNEQSYHTISEYIINNPAKWAGDKFYKL